MRRCSQKDIVADAEDTFGETKFICDDLSAIEFSVVVGISKSDESVGARDELLLNGLFGLQVPDRFCDDKRAIGGEGRDDRPGAQGIVGDLFDRAGFRDREFDRVDLDGLRGPRSLAGILGHARWG